MPANLLFVEDDPLIRRALAAKLRALGHRVREADSVAAAVKAPAGGGLRPRAPRLQPARRDRLRRDEGDRGAPARGPVADAHGPRVGRARRRGDEAGGLQLHPEAGRRGRARGPHREGDGDLRPPAGERPPAPPHRAGAGGERVPRRLADRADAARPDPPRRRLARRGPCCSRARAARARAWSPARSTRRARAPASPSCRSRAARCRSTSSSRRCSGTSRAPSPTRASGRWGSSRPRRAARCSSTRSGTWRRRSRRRSSACWRSVGSVASEASRRSRPTCG